MAILLMHATWGVLYCDIYNKNSVNVHFKGCKSFNNNA